MKKHTFVIGGIIVAFFLSAIAITLKTVDSIKSLTTEVDSHQKGAILASAEVTDQSLVAVPVMYYDQIMDECVNIYNAKLQNSVKARQFEWSSCGYYNQALEKNLTEPFLNSENLPIGREGQKLTNHGLGNNFNRWFHTIEGKSQSYASKLNLTYDEKTISFSYSNDNFYPLNTITVPDEPVNKNGINHLFTMSLSLPVEVHADKKETFTISADDDTWVFINGKIVLDMGGIHEATTGTFNINESGEIYSGSNNNDLSYSGIKLEKGEIATIHIFHADRDSSESIFKLKTTGMLLKLAKDTTIAKAEDTLAVPLGVSSTASPNHNRLFYTSIIVQAFSAIVLIVVATLAILIIKHQITLKKAK